jgi:hypothetical protein
VITERLRRFGYAGSVTVVKDHVRQVRPAFTAAASFQRTSYLPGELEQTETIRLTCLGTVSSPLREACYYAILVCGHDDRAR